MPRSALVAGTLVFFLSACCDCGLASYVPWAPEPDGKDGAMNGGGETNGGGTTGGNGGTNGGGETGGGRNNGFGNGDQDAPGNSRDHNRAENDRGGRSDPSHGGK